MPEIKGRLRTPRLASAPATPITGEMYYDTATNKLYWWNGTVWVDPTGQFAPASHKSTHEPGGSDAMTVDAAAGVGSLRTLQSGASAGNAAMPGNASLDEMKFPQSVVAFNFQRITNLQDPAFSYDAATKGYVDDLINSLAVVARGYPGAAFTVPTGVPATTPIPLDGSTSPLFYDPLGCVNKAAAGQPGCGVITIPEDGYYIATAVFYPDPTLYTGGTLLDLYFSQGGSFNGRVGEQRQPTNALTSIISCTAQFKASAGDTIVTNIGHNTGATRTQPASSVGTAPYVSLSKVGGPKGDQGPAGPSTPIPIVTALPASPVNGQEIYYLANATNGVIWHLRYRAFQADGTTPNPSAYKWEFIGGSPLRGNDVETAESTSSGSYIDLTTVGPQITAPLAGEFLITGYAYVYTGAPPAAGIFAAKLGAAACADTERLGQISVGTGGTNPGSGFGGRNILRTVAKTDVIKMQYRVSGAAAAAFMQRSLEIVPVRVG